MCLSFIVQSKLFWKGKAQREREDTLIERALCLSCMKQISQIYWQLAEQVSGFMSLKCLLLRIARDRPTKPWCAIVFHLSTSQLFSRAKTSWSSMFVCLHVCLKVKMQLWSTISTVVSTLISLLVLCSFLSKPTLVAIIPVKPEHATVWLFHC